MRAERVVSSAGLTSFLRDPRPRDAGNQGPTSVRPQAEAPPSAVFCEPTTIPFGFSVSPPVLTTVCLEFELTVCGSSSGWKGCGVQCPGGQTSAEIPACTS